MAILGFALALGAVSWFIPRLFPALMAAFFVLLAPVYLVWGVIVDIARLLRIVPRRNPKTPKVKAQEPMPSAEVVDLSSVRRSKQPRRREK